MSMLIGFSVPKEPGVYAEVVPATGSGGQSRSKTLMIAPKTSSGTGVAGKPVLITSPTDCIRVFGAKSPAYHMAAAFFNNYRGGELWGLPVVVTGEAAVGEIKVTNAPSTGGVIRLVIGDETLAVRVSASDTVATVAHNIADAIDSSNAEVVVTVDDDTISLAAATAGEWGNGLVIDYTTTTGTTLSITQLSGGSGVPTLSTYLAALAEQKYDTWITAFIDTDCLSAMCDAMAERWSPLVGTYGHVVAGYPGGFADLIEGVEAVPSSEHLTVLPIGATTTPYWTVSAILGALTAQYQMDADDATLAQGFCGHLLRGMMSPSDGGFSVVERDILLHYGYATYTVVDNRCYLSRARTACRDANLDEAYFDQRTLAILMRLLRKDRAAFMQTFGGAVLVDDASRVGGGQRVCSPAIVRGWFAGRYSQYERAGLVTSPRTFLEGLIIERDHDDPSRLNILYPPVLSGWLAVAAIRLQFSFR